MMLRRKKLMLRMRGDLQLGSRFVLITLGPLHFLCQKSNAVQLPLYKSNQVTTVMKATTSQTVTTLIFLEVTLLVIQ